jgi:hypothetical protein
MATEHRRTEGPLDTSVALLSRAAYPGDPGLLGEGDEAEVQGLLRSRGVEVGQFRAFFFRLLGLPRELVLSHLRQTHDLPHYFARFRGAEVADHLGLLARVSDQHPVAVKVYPQRDSDELGVVIVGRDGRGVAALVTGHLADMGFDIRDIRVVIYDPPAAPADKACYVLAIQVFGPRSAAADLAGTERDLQERLHRAYVSLGQRLAAGCGGPVDSVDPGALENWAEAVFDECTKRILREHEEQRDLLAQLTDAARHNNLAQVKHLLLSGEGAAAGGPKSAPYLMHLILAGASSLSANPLIAEQVTVAQLSRALGPRAQQLRQTVGQASPPVRASGGSLPAPAPPEARSSEGAALADSRVKVRPVARLRPDEGARQGEPPPFEDRKVARILAKFWDRLGKPLPVRLRELIHACAGDADADAVREFLRKHQDDPDLAQQAPGILAAFRHQQADPLLRAAAAEPPLSLGEKARRLLRDVLGWSAKPLPVRLRELIHACGGDADAAAVREFLSKHQDDPDLAQQAPGILAAFRHQ